METRDIKKKPGDRSPGFSFSSTETNAYFASFSINLATMLAGTSS
jgi:hypothetical protein